MATVLQKHIGQSKAIVYLDFIGDVNSLAIALRDVWRSILQAMIRPSGSQLRSGASGGQVNTIFVSMLSTFIYDNL